MASEPLTLAALWHSHKTEVPGYAQIIRLAHAGKLPGVTSDPSNNYGFVVEQKQNTLRVLKQIKGEFDGQK